MIKLKLWKPFFYFRLIDFQPRRGTYWLYDMIRKKQVVDDLHHAPACPANHYHKQRLVFQPCTCGANKPLNLTGGIRRLSERRETQRVE